MRVRELIQQLSRLNPDLVVVMPTETTSDLCPVQRVGVDTVEIIKGKMTMSYPYEEGAIEVVMLFDSDLDGQCHMMGLGE